MRWKGGGKRSERVAVLTLLQLLMKVTHSAFRARFLVRIRNARVKLVLDVVVGWNEDNDESRDWKRKRAM